MINIKCLKELKLWVGEGLRYFVKPRVPNVKIAYRDSIMLLLLLKCIECLLWARYCFIFLFY